jgi:hypothetical protein
MDLRMELPRYLHLSPVGKAMAADAIGAEEIA